MADQHAVSTGSITGQIRHGDGTLDVTPDLIFVDSIDEARAVAESIELELARRGVHPVQGECGFLGPLNDAFEDSAAEGRRVALHLGVHSPKAVLKRHQKAHKALNEKAGL